MSSNANGKTFELMENQGVEKASRLRTAIPQVLAVSAKNLILLDLGLCIAFPTIVIPAVQHSSDMLSLDDEQTSWFGSISMICQPVGSVLSGLVLDRLGRKVSLMVVNVPLLLAWALFYFVNSATGLLVAAALLGLGMGLVEAPILTYVAEVSQPELRGMLTSYSEMCVSVGMFCQYLIGTVTDWRTTAAISAAVPIISVIAISQVPESPTWLVSRGRSREAEKSLCWLRGWVGPAAVQEELSHLERYYLSEDGLVNEGANHANKADASCTPRQARSTEKMLGEESRDYDSVLRTLRAMLLPETLRPLIMMILISFLEHWCGVAGTRPFMVQVFEEFGMPIDAHWATVATGLLSICGMLVCLVAVPWCGKRPLMFLSVVGVVACCTLLGIYAYFALPGGGEATNWMPLALFISLFFTHSLGLNPIPWMLLSEIFPFRTRSLAAGTGAAINYVFSFAASKTFLGLKTRLGLYGVYWLYAAVTAVGSLYMLLELKETEGKSLQHIEDFYKKKTASVFENPKTSISSEKLTRDGTGGAKAVQEDTTQEGTPRTQCDKTEEASDDARQHPTPEETTASLEENDTGSPRKVNISGEQSGAVAEKEEVQLPTTSGSPGESSAVPDKQSEGRSTSVGSEDEASNRAARRLPSIPGDDQLRRDEESTEYVSHR